MMNGIKRFLCNKKGEAYISLSVSIWIIIIIFVTISYMLPIFIKQQYLDRFCKTICRQAELDGSVEQDEIYEELCEIYNIRPNITWEWDRYKGTKRVQLNHYIRVMLEDEYIFDVGIFTRLTIPINSKAEGKSEIYWKD